MKNLSLYDIKNRVMGKYFLVFGCMVIMMSCGKDIDLFIPNAIQAETGDISRLIDRLESDFSGEITSTVTCPCYGDKAFEFDKDLVLVIPPGFVDLTKYPCTSGYFDITVTVCDTKGEILAAGIPTVSEGKLLESRIEFKIGIKDGNKKVKLAHGKKIRVLVNDPDPRDRMELFYGNGDDWLQADLNPGTWNNVFNSEWWIQQDSSQNFITGFGYECFSDSLDWINVDVFFEVPEHLRTDVCVVLPEEFTNTNTAVFMVFDNYNSLLGMRGDADLKQFCEPYGATPIGYKVTFVVISEMGEDCYFFASKKATVSSHHLEEITPLKTPYEEIKNYIKNL